jgi:hypothetical protein
VEEGERGYCAGEIKWEKEIRGRGHVWGGQGAPGARGPDRAGPGRAGPHRGSKPTTRTTTNRNPIANRNPKRDETNMRLTTISDKEICFSMMQHPWHLSFVYTWHGHPSLYCFEIGKKERNRKRKESNAWIWRVKGRKKNSTPKFRALQKPTRGPSTRSNNSIESSCALSTCKWWSPFGLRSDAPHHLHYRASNRNTMGLVPSRTRWWPHHKLDWCGLTRLSPHSI